VSHQEEEHELPHERFYDSIHEEASHENEVIGFAFPCEDI